MLQLNIAHTHKRYSHYERQFKPTQLGDLSIHNRGFTSTVFRQPTADELTADAKRSYDPAKHKKSLASYIRYRKSATDGYRAKAYAIGLTNIGYIDLDAITVTDKTLKTPTAENVQEALKGYWNYVHPSASRAEGKLRILYRRNLTVYSTNHYNGHLWNLIPETLGQIQAVTDDNTQIEVDQDLPTLIEYILTQEFQHFTALLTAHGINTSGLDQTALQLHMHSKHITDLQDTPDLSIPINEGQELVSWN